MVKAMGAAVRSSGIRRWPTGFTLIELLVVISVVAVLTAIAVPSFKQMVANSRVRGAANTLQTALLKARSEALKRNCPITVRRNGDWNNGWDVFATADDCSRAAGDEYATAAAPGLFLQRDSVSHVSVTPVPSDVVSLRYLQSGRVQGSGPAFYLRDSGAVAKRKCVIVELDGFSKVVEAGSHARCPEPA